MAEEKKHSAEDKNEEPKEKVEIEDIIGEDELDIEDAVSEGKEPAPAVLEKTDEKVADVVDEMADTEKKDVLEKAVEEAPKEEAEEKPKKTKKKKSDKKDLKIAGLIMLTVLVTAAVVLGVIYYLDQQKEVEEEVKEEVVEEIKEELEEGYVYISSEVGLNMREEPNTDSKVLAIIPYATKITILSEKTGWIETEYQNEKGWVSADYTTKENPSVYENSAYGFSFTFKPSWAGYKFFETNSNEGTAVAGYYVALPTTDTSWKEPGGVDAGYASLFAMAIYTPAEWAKLEAQDGPKPAKLGESSKYVYTYLPGQAHPKDLGAQYNEINDIIKTFELLK